MAQKELEQITPPYHYKIIEAIDALAANPRPDGVKKLKGEEAYRIRVADYRVVYTIEDVIQAELCRPGINHFCKFQNEFRAN